MLYLPDPDNLTPIDHYWIGYFRADGSLSNGGGQFGQIHREPVEAFVQYLGLPVERVKAYKNSSVKSKDYWVYSMGYTAIGRVYRSMGVKSQLQDSSLYHSPHFWRGMVDGDGSISKPSARTQSLSLCGNFEDVTKFAEFLEPHVGLLSTVFPVKSIFVTRVWGDRAKTAACVLYKDQFSALLYKRQLAELLINMSYSDRYLRNAGILQDDIGVVPT